MPVRYTDDIPTTARAQCAQQAKLLAAVGAAEDYFGISVAVSGDVAVVGAYRDDDNGSDSGSAYVFRFDGTAWVQEQKLLAPDGAGGDWFGWSVAVSGDAAVVGARLDNDNGIFSGSAYVFRFDGTAWGQEAKLLAADGAASDQFGFSVGLSGDAAVVGAWQDDDNGPDSGSAYVFRWDGTGWLQEAKLLASDGDGGDQFGWSVAVSGDVAVVGAPSDDDNGESSGSAYAFRWDGTGWFQEAKLLPADGAALDFFGTSVGVSGDAAVVGANRDDDNGTDSGSAYAFRWDGTGWVQEAKLLAADGAAEDYFGISVAVSGDVAVVGALFDDDNGVASGSAYVFRCGDRDGDGILDDDDNCPDYPNPTQAYNKADLDQDCDVDGIDFLTFSNCFNGSLNPPACP